MLDVLFVFHVGPMLSVDLLPDEDLLLCLHLVMNVAHLHVLPQPLIILVPLLVPLELEGLELADPVVVVVVDLVVGLGLVHDLVQRLGQHDLLQVLLVDALLPRLRLQHLVQVVLLPEEQRPLWLFVHLRGRPSQALSDNTTSSSK